MVQTFNIAQRNNVLESLDINDADKRIIESKIKKSKDCYEFITKPYETKKNDVLLLKEIERAIYGRRYTTVKQREGTKIVEYVVKPYKIVFMNENFYLACENTNENYPFSIFRIINIESIKLDSKTFHLNPDIEEFIKHLQTPFPKYTHSFRKHLIEVVVEVSTKKAKFFKAKKHLASQKELKTKEDGTLVLSFTVTQEMEMDDLVKKWIPHMKVVSPLSLKEKIESDLKEYLT
jgi:predicted DNA-binding transcriptional regulator YafY